jgi:hypothetical protein
VRAALLCMSFHPELNTKLKFPKPGLPIVLVFGAGGSRSGRITGLGIGLTGGAEKQIWRMDFHHPHPEPQDIDYWQSGPFHSHVSGWS